ncbi:RNA-directed DNA polymerase, eukaryota, reverse transcriptase zinc-binding domain protein [Tanacetum coccineum]
MLWDYLFHVIANWKGDMIIMGDFNEVRNKNEIFGLVFNVQGANAFNSFISSAGLEEVPLGGCPFTWCHKIATKMSKLDRFLISESLISLCPNISAITLDRYLSDHRPILLRESKYDYGPIPFLFFHYWLEVDGFEKLVKDTWSEASVDTSNAMLNLMKKLKYLKKKICAWNKDMRKNSKNSKLMLKAELSELDSVIDKGDGNGDIINKRMAVVKSIQEVDKFQSMEAAQKAKIKWAIEGNKNSKYYHGILNKKRNQLSIRGDIVNEVQSDFVADRQILDGLFILNELFQWCKSKKKHSFIFKIDFEKAYDSVRWDYLDDVLKKFGFGDRWCGWIQDCLRSSWGSVIVNGSPTEEFQFFKGLKLGDPLSPFIFILIMESLHILFQRVVDAGMFKGIMLDSSMQLSHMFYDDDAVFVGQWSGSNIDTIVHVLDCFYRASGLRINMSSKVRWLMSRIQSWNEIVDSMVACLSKWKMNTLSIGGLGVSSLYALNRALMFKWIWRFITQKTSLWARVIKAIHGDDKKIGKNSKSGHVSIWRKIVQEMEVFKKQENVAFKYRYPRLYALESCKRIDVAAKLGHSSMVYSFLRVPRSGAEQSQLEDLLTKIEGVSLMSMNDRWVWSLESSGDFFVATVRKLIDDSRLSEVSFKTRWIKAVPIKVNVHVWKVRLDCLPTRLNISRRGMDIASILCPICGNAVESLRHLFFDSMLLKRFFERLVVGGR